MEKATISDFAWFNIDNYDFINKITVEELIHELEWRHTLFYCHDENKTLDELGFEDSIKYFRIFRGDPHLNINSPEEIEFNKEYEEYAKSSGRDTSSDRPMLPHDQGVMPLSFAELSQYSKVAQEIKAYSLDDNGNYTHIDPRSMLASVSYNAPDYMNHKVLIDIWLDEATDEEILSSLKKLLPVWRDKLGHPEPDILPKRRVGLKTFQKLITNRVLMILDLILWAEVFKKEISNPMLSHLVFPDDPKDSQAIKETIRPFSIEAMSEPYTRLLRLFIDKDGELGSAKVSDMIDRIS